MNVLDMITAIPNDGDFHPIREGVCGRRRDLVSVTVSVQAEYPDNDPNLGYVEGCPAAVLASEIPCSRIRDCGTDGPGFEYWAVWAPVPGVAAPTDLARIQAALDEVPMAEDLRPFNGLLRPAERCQGLTGLAPEPDLVAIVIHDGGDLSLYVSPTWRQRIITCLEARGYRYAELDTTDGTAVYGGVFAWPEPLVTPDDEKPDLWWVIYENGAKPEHFDTEAKAVARQRSFYALYDRLVPA